MVAAAAGDSGCVAVSLLPSCGGSSGFMVGAGVIAFISPPSDSVSPGYVGDMVAGSVVGEILPWASSIKSSSPSPVSL